MMCVDSRKRLDIQPWLDHVPELLARLRLLISSYVALNLILAIRVHVLLPRLVCLGLVVLGILDAMLLLSRAKETDSQPREIISVRDSGGEVAAYLATYLLPLLAASSPSGADLWAYGVYGFMLVVISLRSDLLHINPTLYLLGLRVITLTTKDGDERPAICRTPPQPNTLVSVTDTLGLWYVQQTSNKSSSLYT
jgi:hypothetical protein